MRGSIGALSFGCVAALAACGAEPAPAPAPSAEAEKAAAQAILDDLTTSDDPVASYPSSLPQVSTWNIHVGSTVAIVGVDEAGLIHAALALDADGQLRWCVRAAIDAGCGEIAAAMAKDLGATGGTAELRALHPLDSAPMDDATACSTALTAAADQYAQAHPSESPAARLVSCTLAGVPAMKWPPGCSTVYSNTSDPKNITYSSADGLAAKCCDAHPPQTDTRPGTVTTLVSNKPVPIFCGR
jgi:hypothetical protein